MSQGLSCSCDKISRSVLISLTWVFVRNKDIIAYLIFRSDILLRHPLHCKYLSIASMSHKKDIAETTLADTRQSEEIVHLHPSPSATQVV